MRMASNNTFAEHMKKKQFDVSGQSALDYEDAILLSMSNGTNYPKPGSFYMIIMMAIASWVVTGAIALAIDLMLHL